MKIEEVVNKAMQKPLYDFLTKHPDEVFKSTEIAKQFDMNAALCSYYLHKHKIPTYCVSSHKIYYGSREAIQKFTKLMGGK